MFITEFQGLIKEIVGIELIIKRVSTQAKFKWLFILSADSADILVADERLYYYITTSSALALVILAIFIHGFVCGGRILYKLSAL